MCHYKRQTNEKVIRAHLDFGKYTGPPVLPVKEYVYGYNRKQLVCGECNSKGLIDWFNSTFAFARVVACTVTDVNLDATHGAFTPSCSTDPISPCQGVKDDIPYIDKTPLTAKQKVAWQHNI